MTAQLTDTGILLHADTDRVVARFFVPGREDLAPGASRAGGVVDRVLALSETQVERALREVVSMSGSRHRRLEDVLRAHASMVISRVGPEVEMTDARVLLLGATFTREDSLEGAALCNPSIVPHPVQTSDDAAIDFVLSVRGIGEGHRSSIGFRTGTLGHDGTVTIDRAGPFPEVATRHAGLHRRSVFHARFTERGNDPENIEFILDGLDDLFDDEQLEARIALLFDDASRSNTAATVDDVRTLAASGYLSQFAEETELSERVLWPHAPAESHGLEDARFVRFTEDNGKVTYYATYTAFDGLHIQQHMLDTKDFRTFRSAPMTGPAAGGKGLALFPRRVHGRFLALTRSDRESNEIASSDDPRHWPEQQSIQVPERAWEMVQLGNCGSPIETDLGWLVLTHGVGPMRTYSLGAILLDLADPTRMIARTDDPVLSPTPDRLGGYVPNVVYTCGSMAHGDTLLLPYGVGDQSIAIATLSISELLRGMRRV